MDKSYCQIHFCYRLLTFICMEGEQIQKLARQYDLNTNRKHTQRPSRNQHRKNKYKQMLQEQSSPDWPESVAEVTPTLDRSLKKSSIRNLGGEIARSMTEAKKKESKIVDLYSDRNIFKLPSTSLIGSKMSKQDIRLPTLDRKKIAEEDLNLNPQKRKLVRISLDKLKPVPVDEVKRRFMLKYKPEGLKT